MKSGGVILFISSLFIFESAGLLAQGKNKCVSSECRVIENYCNMGYAAFSDSYKAAMSLRQDIAVFLAKPTERNLERARASWRAARIPYQQTEVYRFGNPIVDDWEGKVNAWPLDEGLIDYVDRKSYGSSDENPFYTANIIANPKLQLGSSVINSPKITARTLEDLQEVGGIESNVARGYHAIEFLLWGQDLNGHKPGAGIRKATDYDQKNCSNKNCDRRGQYLNAAVDLLIMDLKFMVTQWRDSGPARIWLMRKGKERQSLKAMLTGMGSLSYGELAGERIKLGWMLHDPEEEHDCFSDNTHASHYYDALGIRNIYLGAYKAIDGKVTGGPGLTSLVVKKSAEVDKKMRKALDNTMAKMDLLVKSAENGEAYDQLLASGNRKGERIITGIINALTIQTKSIEKVVSVLSLDSIEFVGSDSLDRPEKVQ